MTRGAWTLREVKSVLCLISCILAACAGIGVGIGKAFPEASGVNPPSDYYKVYYEDGSWELWDGTKGCTKGAPCDEPEDIWAGGDMPAIGDLPTCKDADSAGCFYPGRADGDLCNWVNSPDLKVTWFFNCVDPSMNGRVDGESPKPKEPQDTDDLPLCEENLGYPCWSDFGDVTVYEDGSWVDAAGNTGCIPGEYCDPESEVAPVCADEYESTDCYYTQGGDTWYVDAEGVAHLTEVAE